MADDVAAEIYNRFGRLAGFGRGRTTALRNVPAQFLVNVDAGELKKVLRDQGRFIRAGGLTTAMEQAHREMAITAGEYLVRAFETAQNEIGRPQNRGLFKSAIRDPGNRVTTPTGWGVGLPSHYDRKSDRLRRYWRFIEFGGPNPMDVALSRGTVIGRFWNPFVAFPSAGQFRRQGRFAWKYKESIVTPNRRNNKGQRVAVDPVTGLQRRLDVVAGHPGAIFGTPDKPDDYIKVRVGIGAGKGGVRRFATVWFRKPKKGNAVTGFDAFDGYYFHALGEERYLASEHYRQVYRRLLAPHGVQVE